ncbi:M1 family metallopeptidase [Maribacter sp. MAR_2009_72]|uniref:M1 family metallopeptidase n=1 Tax=Maribacter sp. MAR_2009_72 TaxID=1250050 RepID=UPI00119A22B3|nr:M1 family metallopeptidase [Maribacter sp. MAR_2009_72]TVZ14042.1 aminopeptidase N [Maribacter sp. MAR_2009_72]
MKPVVFLFLIFTFALGNAQNRNVDFVRISATISPDTLAKEIQGKVRYTFHQHSETDSIFIDGVNINVIEFRLNGRKRQVFNNGKKIGFRAPKKNGEHHVELDYVAQPVQALYFVGFNDAISGNEQIWTQGQGKYTSHWLPSFDDMNEKVEVDLKIIYFKNNEVIANGLLVDKTPIDGKLAWSFDMERPMSSYLIAFAIGKYKKQVLRSESGIPIENYYYPKEELKVEPTYRYTKRIFDFLEKEIEFDYPWQNYKQVPVHDFLYAGMENTGATLFSDSYLIDSVAFKDSNYVNVNAHELAHQWFGNLVTEESGNHHWLQEGFATYYAYLAERSIFGEDKFYWKYYDTAASLRNQSEDGKGQSLLDPNADSLTFYEKGAWALLMLREQLGDQAFRQGITSYLKKYSFSNATVTDFLKEMEAVSGQNLNSFKEEWLVNTDFPYEKAMAFLYEKSASIQRYHAIADTIGTTETYYKDSIMTSFWNDSTSVHLKKQFILDFHSKISDATLSELLQENEIKPRQYLAISRDPIFKTLKPLFESMLTDDSYVTKETVFYKLWVEFPEKRSKYLNILKDEIGLPSKNIRTLWLALAMVTPSYNLVKKSGYLKELKSYTSSRYNTEVRQNAFMYLSNLKVLEGEALENLIKATNHHSWQFRTFARRMLDEELQDEDQRQRIDSLSMRMDTKDLQYLKKKMK